MKVRKLENLQKKMTKSIMLFICPLILAAVLVVSLAVACAVFSDNSKTVMINDGDALYELTANCDTVGEALALVGVSLEENEVLNCDLNDSIDSVDVIRISQKIKYGNVEYTGADTLVKFEKVEETPVIPEELPQLPGIDKDFEDIEELLPVETVIPDVKPEVVVTPAPTPTPVPTPTPTPTPVPTPTPEPTPVVTLGYEDIIEEVPFDTTYVEDNTMLEGDSKVVSEGEVGIKTHVYEITYVDGVETGRELVKVKDTKAPVNRVVAKGTISNFLSSRGDKVAFTKKINCVATAYTDSAKWGNKVYWTNQLGGLTTRWGVIAVDPNVIPLGTLVYIKGVGTDDYGYAICADIGGSIKGNKVDLWMDCTDICFQWGVKNVEVYILEDQSCDVFALRGDYEWAP